jgi:ATP-binding cassette subfamily B protein
VMEADQILVINNGIVAERGRHEELISKGGLYSELFARQDLTTS